MQLFRAPTFIAVVMGVLFALTTVWGPAAAQNSDLPWGQSKEPSLITPDTEEEDEDEDPRNERDMKTPLPSSGDTYRRNSYNPPRERAYNRDDRRDNEDEDRFERRRRSYEDDRRDIVRRLDDDGPVRRKRHHNTFSDDEILREGHKFFGKVTKGLAKVIAHAFSSEGRPNGYILGEEAGGALIAGLRYGEGILVTKDFGRHKVYWQGPSIGYDFGAEGSKTMILVYDMIDPGQIYQKYSGVNGSAYLVGGVGLTFQQKDDVKLARIQSGVGVRLGANIGYLKYTRTPTWNPF